MRRGLSLVVALALVAPATVSAEPMECTEDYLRMALGNQGVLPKELLLVCLRVEADDPDYAAMSMWVGYGP